MLGLVTIQSQQRLSAFYSTHGFLLTCEGSYPVTTAVTNVVKTTGNTDVVICVVMYVTLLPAVAGNLSGPDTCVSYPAREDLLLLTSPPTRPGTLVPARLDGGATG